MDYSKPDTLAWIDAVNPVRRRVSLARVQVNDVIGGYGDYAGEAHPEDEAARFYLLDHALAEARSRWEPEEPLPSEALVFLKENAHRTAMVGWRLFYYLLFICCREARHAHTTSSDDKACAQLAEKWGAPAAYAHLEFPDKAARHLVASTIGKKAGVSPVLNLAAATRDKFYALGFDSSYGGPKWGAVADVLVAFCEGRVPMHIMVDAAWALEHNTATIFNKGMFYQHPDETVMLGVLDMQRAGQLPQFLSASKDELNARLSGRASVVLERMVSSRMAVEQARVAGLNFGAMAEGLRVDWDGVKQSGALGSYSAKSVIKPAPPVLPGGDKVYPGPAATKKQTIHIIPGHLEVALTTSPKRKKKAA